MPGRVTRFRPHALLAIVFGLFLVVVGITATAQAVMVSLRFSTAALNWTVGNDAATVQTWANTYLRPADLEASLSADRRGELDGQLEVLAERAKVARIEIRDLTGRILLSNAPSAVGNSAAI